MKSTCKYPDKLDDIAFYANKLVLEYNQSVKYSKLSERERNKVISHVLGDVSSLIEHSKKEELEENLSFLAILNKSKKKFEAINLSNKERDVQRYFKKIFNIKYSTENLIKGITGKKNYTPKSEWIPFRPEVQKLYKEYIREVLDCCIKDLIAANTPHPNAKKVSFKTKIEEVREIPNRNDTVLVPIQQQKHVPQSTKIALIPSFKAVSTRKNKLIEEVGMKENIAESAKKRRRLK